jgi:hypothetical protein
VSGLVQGDELNRWRFRDRLVVGGACAGLLASALVPVAASAAGNGSVKDGRKALSAGATIAPGDYLNFGYALSMSGSNAAATIQIIGGIASFPVTCGSGSATIQVGLPDATISIPAKDSTWYPTSSATAYQGYEVSAQVPNNSACGNRAMTLGSGDANGVLYTATLKSANTSDPISIQFHGVDANSNGKKGNVDCSSSQNSPNTKHSCTGAWAPAVSTTAASNSSSSGSSSSGTTSSGSGNGSGATGSGTTGSGTTSSGSGNGSGATGSGTTSSGSGSGSGSGGSTTTGGGSSTGGGTTTGGTHTGGGSGTSSGPTHTGGSGTTAAGGVVIVVPGKSAVPGPGKALPVGSVQGLSVQGAAPAPASSAAPQGHAPVSQPSAPSQSVVDTVLGGVPVLVPSIANALARAGGALPWNWFLGLALLDGLLVTLIVIRRRRAVPPA